MTDPVNIKELRRRLKKELNRSAASRSIGIDVAHVSRILSGRSNPSIVVARKITAYLQQNGYPEMTTDLLCDVLGINGLTLLRHEEGNDGNKGLTGS